MVQLRFILLRQVLEVTPKIETAMKKSTMTIYLSCSNVSSLKTFCEVKLQVCVSAHYMK